jgi:murein L,D-transpeptidase YcbB/YkuD
MASVPAGISHASDEVTESLRQRLETGVASEAVMVGGEGVAVPSLVRDFYSPRGYEPAWGHGDALIRRTEALLSAIARARDQGLRPGDYDPARIEAVLAHLTQARPPDRAAARADAELVLTSSWLALAQHLHGGRVDPESLRIAWHSPRDVSDPELPAALEKALAHRRIEADLLASAPTHPAYRGLYEVLAEYRRIEDNGGWATLSPGPSLSPGDRGERVMTLRRRLAQSRDAPGEANEPALFGEELAAAVRGFQRRHGLVEDAIVGPATRAAVNVPVGERIRQLRVNMERWRWLPRELGARYITVNIAGFSMRVVSGHETVIRQRVIVGRHYRQTPVFSDRMIYIVLNPSWSVPRSIAVKDLLPEIRADPSFLDRMGFEVLRGWGADEQRIDPETVDWDQIGGSHLPFRFRQRPGPRNALGKMKFMFPNEHAVYLHDTPSRQLFSRPERAFSSGCIRVEAPHELAVYLLQGSERWNADTLERALAERSEQTVMLPAPVPIYLQYLTAWVDESSGVQFRRDIYQRDSAVGRALDAEFNN